MKLIEPIISGNIQNKSISWLEFIQIEKVIIPEREKKGADIDECHVRPEYDL